MWVKCVPSVFRITWTIFPTHLCCEHAVQTMGINTGMFFREGSEPMSSKTEAAWIVEAVRGWGKCLVMVTLLKGRGYLSSWEGQRYRKGRSEGHPPSVAWGGMGRSVDLYRSTLVLKEPLKPECDLSNRCPLLGILYETRDGTQTLCPERSPRDDFQSSLWGSVFWMCLWGFGESEEKVKVSYWGTRGVMASWLSPNFNKEIALLSSWNNETLYPSYLKGREVTFWCYFKAGSHVVYNLG